MRFALLLSLFSSLTFAQVLSSDRGVRFSDVFTTAVTTLYVDPTGNDALRCTASGAAACATLGGALSKVPPNVRHNVTVNVATGTYAEVFRLQGFNVAAGPTSATQPVLAITGTQVAFAPTTGSSSGTVTSYTGNAGNGVHPTLTDSTQSWTVNNLRGRYVTITAGPGLNEYHLIASNTATTLSLAYHFTVSPTSASTYAIRTPGPVFTGSAGSIRGLTGSGSVVVTDISLQPPSGTAFSVNSVATQLTTTRMRLLGLTSGVTTATNPAVGATSWRLNQTYVTAGSGSGFSVAAFSRLTFVELFLHCTGTCAGVGLFNSATASGYNSVTGTIAGSFTSMVSLASATNSQSTGLWIDCTNPAANGIYIQASSDTTLRTGAGWAANAGPYINGCANGYSLNAPGMSYIDNGNVFTNVTNAIVLSGGHRAVIEAGTTASGVTNFLTLDGTVYTDADLTASTRLTGVQGSHATRP